MGKSAFLRPFLGGPLSTSRQCPCNTDTGARGGTDLANEEPATVVAEADSSALRAMPSILKSELGDRFQDAFQEYVIPVVNLGRFPEIDLRRPPHFISPTPRCDEKIPGDPETAARSRRDLIRDMIGLYPRYVR